MYFSLSKAERKALKLEADGTFSVFDGRRGEAQKLHGFFSQKFQKSFRCEMFPWDNFDKFDLSLFEAEILRWLERTEKCGFGPSSRLETPLHRRRRTRMIKMKSYGWAAHHVANFQWD